MRVIRRGVFETNSSSTHTICIVPKEDFEKWEKGELFYDIWNDKLIKKEEAEYPEDAKTYKEFTEDEYLEYYEESYKTKSGEEIVIFGKYGREG